MQKLLLIVPAFNEEASLPTTIEALRTQPYDFIIVNDGSSDHTAEIAKQMRAPVIDLPFNQGIAGAFLAGMQYAKTHGYTYVLQFDADGQHLPQYIEPMLKEAVETNTDILIGSRFRDQPMPKSLRTFGSVLIRWMLRLTTGQVLRDPTSDMRMYNRRMIDFFSARTDLTPEPDTIAYLMRNGVRVGEYPVTMRERIAGTSYLGSWPAIKYMSRMAFSILMIQFVRSRIREREVLV